MKKNKKRALIVAIIFSIIFILLGTFLIDNDVKKEKYDDLCRQINNAKNNKKDFIMAINHENMLTQNINELKNTYKSLVIFNVDYQKIKKNCFKEILMETGEYENLLSIKDSALIGYKEGIYEGVIFGQQTSLNSVKEYFIQLEIIKKDKIEDRVTFEEYKQKTTEDEYYLILITDESIRELVTNNAKKVFSDNTIDIININGENGMKINKDIKAQIEITSYPSIFYFKKGSLISTGKAAREIYLERFKEQVNK